MSTYQPRFPLPKLRSRRSHLVPFAIGLLLLFGQTNLTRAISLWQIVTVDTDNVGAQLSLALDAAGNPVISYLDAVNEDLKLLRCNDHRCSGNDESIQIVDSLDNVGWHSSLALDAADNPVISYVDRSNLALKLVHCNDHSCSGNDESIQTLDRAGFVGEFASLRLDRAGYPVISYADTTNGDLKLIHCNDPNCSGDDESIQRIDSEGTVGAYSSLQLDANGYPVISYFDQTNFDLKLAHCNDVNCAGNDESIQTVDSTDEVGAFTSLILDQAGHPVISYYDTTNSALKLAHCNDTDCRGNDESIQTVDSSGAVGGHSSLALNAAGHPIISYLDAGNGDLKLVRCNDANCSGNDDQIEVVDSAGQVGSNTSLLLDAAGLPVIAYHDDGNAALKLARLIEEPGEFIGSCGGYDVRRTGNRYSADGWQGAIKVGTTGNDTLIGTRGPTLILGLAGNDWLRGRGDADLLCGGDGVDFLQGFGGNDLLDGGNGNDVLNGGRGDYDQLLAGAGNDVLLDGDGVSRAAGGPGEDLFTIILHRGWRDSHGELHFAGLTAGYGDDTVALGILHWGRFLVEISGDEYDDPPNPAEGAHDSLAFIGLLDRASSLIKFEHRLVLSANEAMTIPSEEAGADYLTAAVGAEGVDSDRAHTLFLPLINR